jgi:hypothetical protein
LDQIGDAVHDEDLALVTRVAAIHAWPYVHLASAVLAALDEDQALGQADHKWCANDPFWIARMI